MKNPLLLLSSLIAVFLLSGCASDWDYFWHGDGSPSAPASASSGYTPSYTPAPSYSSVESQDQKDRNYRQELDRKINSAVYGGY